MIQTKPYSYARKNLITCGIGDSIKYVAKLFEDENVGSALVKDERGEYVGMITDSIVFHAVQEGRDVSKMFVKDFQLLPLIKVSKDISFEEISDLFKKHHVGRIAMVDENGKVVAVLKKKNLERFSSFNMASTISSLKK